MLLLILRILPQQKRADGFWKVSAFGESFKIKKAQKRLSGENILSEYFFMDGNIIMHDPPKGALINFKGTKRWLQEENFLKEEKINEFGNSGQ